jgi:hypothetical protein
MIVQLSPVVHDLLAGSSVAAVQIALGAQRTIGGG